MTEYPNRIEILEEGPREGFQIEPGPIATRDKIALIDSLSATGLRRIQVASFVDPKRVPGWADADAVVAGFTPRTAVEYVALYFNPKGLQRARSFPERLAITGSITVSASEAFSARNLNRDRAGQLDAMRMNVAAHQAADVAVTRISVMASFGCNFSGEVAPEQALSALEDAMELARDTGSVINRVVLADSMGWANPLKVERLVGLVRARYPSPRLTLHLHDTRGLGIACAHAGLRMGVDAFDSAVGGLGGCPFAAQPGAQGNIATEELVFLCEELGIETGVDLDALLEASALAERVVGHRLPAALLRAGGLAGLRTRARAA